MTNLAKNYFELFGLRPTFELDKQQLSQQYRQLQKKVHPDKFASHSSSEKRLSLQFTSFINNAFHVLKSPLLRAEYLLELSLMGRLSPLDAIGPGDLNVDGLLRRIERGGQGDDPDWPTIR
ncbi:MAG: Fe-S protein assembly co-chaperone HscB, partial [Pseudomonadota bacterium]